jgi:hypothetical protein
LLNANPVQVVDASVDGIASSEVDASTLKVDASVLAVEERLRKSLFGGEGAAGQLNQALQVKPGTH